MSETGTTQLRLSRLNGVGQPSISQFLSGRVGFTDAMLSRLIQCMGFRLEVTRNPVPADLSRSAERSWKLHRGLALNLTPLKLGEWAPTTSLNIARIRAGVQGEPHLRNLEVWHRIIDDRDVPAIRWALTGLDITAVEMREVSPMGGILPQEERAEILGFAG